MADEDWGSAILGLGGAAGDLFTMFGQQKQSDTYAKAKSLADMNTQLAGEAESIQKYQQQRTVMKVLGTQQADIAAAGLAQSGSAQDLLRSSASQGALAKAGIEVQGEIQQNASQQQAAAAQAQSDAAKKSAQSSGMGGLMQLAPLALMFL
jgi:hypothetical protein